MCCKKPGIPASSDPHKLCWAFLPQAADTTLKAPPAYYIAAWQALLNTAKTRHKPCQPPECHSECTSLSELRSNPSHGHDGSRGIWSGCTHHSLTCSIWGNGTKRTLPGAAHAVQPCKPPSKPRRARTSAAHGVGCRAGPEALVPEEPSNKPKPDADWCTACLHAGGCRCHWQPQLLPVGPYKWRSHMKPTATSHRHPAETASCHVRTKGLQFMQDASVAHQQKQESYQLAAANAAPHGSAWPMAAGL